MNLTFHLVLEKGGGMSPTFHLELEKGGGMHPTFQEIIKSCFNSFMRMEGLFSKDFLVQYVIQICSIYDLVHINVLASCSCEVLILCSQTLPCLNCYFLAGESSIGLLYVSKQSQV